MVFRWPRIQVYCRDCLAVYELEPYAYRPRAGDWAYCERPHPSCPGRRELMGSGVGKAAVEGPAARAR